MIEAIVRLPIAARAVGNTSKALEHWLAGGLTLICQPDRKARTWRAVAPLDLVRLAVINRLLAYGFSVAEGEGVLARTVDDMLLAYPLSGLPCDFGTVLFKLAGWSLTVSRDAEGRICASRAPMFGPDIGDDHGPERLTLDLCQIADAVRVRLESNVPPALSASPGGAVASKARLGNAGGTRSQGKPGSPATIEESTP